MSDGSISQAEIDALLGGGSSSSTATPSGSGVGGQSFDGASKFVDGNILQFSSKLGVATAATASFVKTAVEEKEKDSFLQELPDMVVATYIDFAGMMQGGHTFVLSETLAKKIIELENHEKDVEIDDMIETVEDQPNPAEKESLFKEKEKEEVEESGFLYDNFGKEDPKVDYSPIF